MKPINGARYESLYRFTPAGETRYRSVMSGGFPNSRLDPTSEEFAIPIPGTKPFRVRRFHTSKEMAQAIIGSFEQGYSPNMYDWNDMWNWLSFVLREQIFKHDDKGAIKKMHEARWFAGGINGGVKPFRHAVRMSVLLYNSFGDDADHLLASSPDKHTDILEQFTHHANVLQPVLQKVARKLYFDDTCGMLKKNTGSRGPGSPRRFVIVVKQLDITHDLSDVGFERMLEMLPREFDPFLSSSV